MTTNRRELAFISFYDEDSQQVKFCVVPRQQVQASIDPAVTLTAPPDAPDNSIDPITDEEARKLGGIAYLCHAREHVELRQRLQIITEQAVDWTPPEPPAANCASSDNARSGVLSLRATHPHYSVLLSHADDRFIVQAVEQSKAAALAPDQLQMPILLDEFGYKLDDEFARRLGVAMLNILALGIPDLKHHMHVTPTPLAVNPISGQP